MADNTTIIFNQVAKTGTFGSVIDAVNSNFDLAKIAILNMKGKSAYELWKDEDGNENKSLDDFWRYLTADKGYEKIPLASASNLPLPGDANLNAIYVYPDPEDSTKSITAVSNSLQWIILFRSDGNIKQMGDDIEALKDEAVKVHYFGNDYYNEFGSGEVPTSAVESFGFGGKEGDMLQIIVNATGYVTDSKFLELYGKATSNGEWVAISGCSWYAALDRRVTLENDYAEIGFKLGSTVDEAEVKASLLDEKAALSDISAKIDGYYTCSSNPQNDKTINAKWFRMRNGSKIIIKFTYSNTKPTPVTLNINGTGAKNIYINGKQAGLDNTWKKGSVCLCWYDANEQHYNLKVLFDDDGDLSESVGILNDLYLNSSDWEDITNSASLTTGFKYNVSTSSGVAIGSTQENNSYAYTEPIPLNKGEAIRVKSYGNLFCPIQESDENGNILARLVTYTGSDAYNDYSYIATKDMYVVVNVRIHNTYLYKIEKSGGLHDMDFSKIPLIDELWLNGVDWGEDLANNTEVVSEYHLGRYRQVSYGTGYVLEDNTTYAYSSPIHISKGQSVKIKCYGNSFIPLMECDDSGNVLNIIYPYPSGTNKYVEYSFVANRDMYIKICGRKQDSAYPSSLYISSSLWSLDAIKNLMATLYNGTSVKTSDMTWADVPTLITDKDVVEGEVLYYAVSTSQGMWNIRFYKEDESAQSGYSQIQGTEIAKNPCEPNVTYYGKFVVPTGFALAKSTYGTVNITIYKANTIIADNIEQKALREELDEVKYAMANSSTLPVYYKNYLDEKEIEIRDLQLDIEGKEDNFIFITDSHWSDNYKQSPAIIESILKRGLTNKVVFGGDMMAEDTAGTIEDVKAQVNFHRKFASIVQSCASMFFNIRGNHDINGKNTGDAEKWRATEKATENVLMQPTEVFSRIKNVSGLDYVFDNDAKGFRYIILGNATTAGVSTNSINWLIDVLSQTPSGYDIIVLCHYGSLLSTLTAYMANVDNILSAVNKNQSGQIGSKEYNFTNATYSVIAYISGHTHKNLQSFSAGVTHICTACDARYSENPYMNEKPYSRAQGSVTEQLFDFIQIDKAANMIYCKRIGGGYDRYFHTQPNSVANGNSITLEAVMLNGELTWGCYDNGEAVTKTDSTQITSSIVSVSDGVVTGIAVGEAVVYAMDATGNREFFEVIVG